MVLSVLQIIQTASILKPFKRFCSLSNSIEILYLKTCVQHLVKIVGRFHGRSHKRIFSSVPLSKQISLASLACPITNKVSFVLAAVVVKGKPPYRELCCKYKPREGTPDARIQKSKPVPPTPSGAAACIVKTRPLITHLDKDLPLRDFG